jgi:ankyrin repeat protein
MKRKCGMAALILFGAFTGLAAEADPIHDAAAAGKVESVRRFLSGGAGVDAKAATGATPLHIASTWGHKDVAGLLLSKGADVNAKDGNGMTPLHFAANGDHKFLSMLLIENGAAVDAKALNGMTPLHVAAVWGHTSVAIVLIANGADVNARADGDPGSLRVTESAARCHKDLAALLRKNGMEGNPKEGAGKTPLHLAILNGQNEMAGILREHGAGK